MKPSLLLLREVFSSVQSLNDGLLIVDRDNRVTYLNPSAEIMTGWSLDEAIGKPGGIVFRVVNALTGKATWQPVVPSMDEDQPYVLLPNSVLVRRDMTEVPIEDTATPIHNTEGEVTGAVITFRDSGKKRGLLRKVLERTRRDPLTGLFDRTQLEEQLTRWRNPGENSRGPVLLFLDIDHFKSINDRLGHLAGDFVLSTTATRLHALMTDGDLVCRVGGDEFVVLLEQSVDPDAVRECAAKILLSLREPMVHSENGIEVTASLGIAFGNGLQTNDTDLLDLADAAMYRAKRAGGNRFEWNSQIDETAASGQATSAEKEEPELDEGRVVLHYQPIVELKSGRVTGSEALLRWKTPGAESSLPPNFISRAERNGSIIHLGQIVMRQALRQLSTWHALGYVDLTMNVNVSAIELRNPSYLTRLDQILEAESFVPGTVVIELTEAVLVNSEQQGKLLQSLTERGLRIAVDDFGTKYSNLSYLRRVPLSIIKIDREFLQQVPGSEQDARLLKAMIEMAHSLDYAVIIEGVETEIQRAHLQELPCAYGQGFFFGEPVTADHFLLNLSRLVVSPMNRFTGGPNEHHSMYDKHRAR